jgi:hypothetical protein
MSDFLFRMVERAAGHATATPQPPKTFQWMAPAAALPPQYPVASVWETQAQAFWQPAAKFNPVKIEAPDNRSSVDVQSGPQRSVLDSSFPLENAGETSQPLVQPSPAVQSKPYRDVTAEATKEAASRFRNRFLQNTEQAAHKVNVSHLAVEAAPSKRQPLSRRPGGTIIVDHEAAHFPLEEGIQKTSIHTVQPATPLPRESRSQARDVRTPKPASEPPVEVKIGRVEIHFDAPTPAASPAPARPGGFTEYAELRRYASRKR